MLYLKRNNHFNELYKCDISQEYIVPGDYYYEDDVDKLIVKAVIYHDIIKQKKEEEFNYEKLNKLTSNLDYENMLKEYERNFLTSTLLDRQVAGKEESY